MILDKCTIVIIPPIDTSDAKPKRLQLTQGSDFAWLQDEASKIFCLKKDKKLEFLIRQGSAEILLTEQTFSDFKKISYLNKIIRIIELDTEELVSLAGVGKNQVENQFKEEEVKELESDYSSFLVDELPSLLSMLEGWGLALPQKDNPKHTEDLSESLLKRIGSSLQPIISGILTQISH